MKKPRIHVNYEWGTLKEVTLEEAKRLGANVLVLDRNTVVMDVQHPRLIAEVGKRKHTVIEVPYDAVASWGGAFRCSHHPLVREDASP